MRSLIQSIFGSYTPLAGLSGIASVDFEWLSGVLIFCIVLFCILRMIGGFIKK